MSHACARTDHLPLLRETDAGIAEQIARGREALAAYPGSTTAPGRPRDRRAIASLLTLLWHHDTDVRRAAALALPGGDRWRPYQPQYGHFAAAFLRYLGQHSPDGRPETEAARYDAVVAALRSMLEQSNRDIRAMSNMHYSFLSSALYLALLFTCRDVTESARRLCDGALHAEICHLLGSLTHTGVARRLNAQDAESLASSAGQALAAMPADEIPEFWCWLSHHARARRRAVAPTLHHLMDTNAVPHLLRALAGQPPDVLQPLIGCLGRIGHPDALPALQPFTRSRRRALRGEALAAIELIRRTGAAHPSRTLLRPIQDSPTDNLLLLRPADGHGDPQPDQLLRPPVDAVGGAENRG
jgi:hypothetical protein